MARVIRLSSELPPDDDHARLMSPGFAQPRFRPTGLAGTSGASNTTTGRATTARSRLRASCQSQRQPEPQCIALSRRSRNRHHAHAEARPVTKAYLARARQLAQSS